MIAGIVFLILLAVIMVYFFFTLKNEKSDKEKQEKELDEFIYDPVSGARMTLEQAESGHFISSDSELRVKSDEEIERYYKEDEREVEYIKRHFASAKMPESDNEELTETIYGLEMTKQFETFDLIHLWELRSHLYFGLIQISNQYTVGRFVETVVEVQMLLCSKQMMTSPLTEKLNEWDLERTHDWLVFRCQRKSHYNDFKEVISVLGSNNSHI